MAEKDAFVRRWSRRKEEARRHGAAAPEPDDAAAARDADRAAKDPGEAPKAADESVVAALPDIESLGEGSDFSAFMREGVPEELRRRALRKLWRSKPAFSVICELDQYNEDFTDAALAVKGPLKSIYKAGRGYLEKVAKADSDGAGKEAERPPEGQERVAEADGDAEAEPSGDDSGESKPGNPKDGPSEHS